MAFEICEFVIFPLIVRSIVVPLSVIAPTVDTIVAVIGVTVGAGVSSGVEVRVGEGGLIVTTAKVETINAKATTVRMIVSDFCAFANAVC
jgi:hypothetical protein